MKTTVIKVQEVETEIEIKFLGIRLMDMHEYSATLKNGKKVKLKTKEQETYLIFDNGNIRFNKPVKFFEDVK